MWWGRDSVSAPTMLFVYCDRSQFSASGAENTVAH